MVLPGANTQYKPGFDEYLFYVQQSEPNYKSKRWAPISRAVYKEQVEKYVQYYMLASPPLFELVSVFTQVDYPKSPLSKSMLEKIAESGVKIPNNSHLLILAAKPIADIEEKPDLQERLASFEDGLIKEYNMARVE